MIAVRVLALLGIASVLAGTASAQSVEAEEARYSESEVTLQECSHEPVRAKKKSCLIQLRGQRQAELAARRARIAELKTENEQLEARLAEQKEEGEKLEATLRGLKRVVDLQEADKKDAQPE